MFVSLIAGPFRAGRPGSGWRRERDSRLSEGKDRRRVSHSRAVSGREARKRLAEREGFATERREGPTPCLS